ncbi:MAG: hypothetical protein ACI4LM_04485, partial [Anaerovoracaceae bacterium]
MGRVGIFRKAAALLTAIAVALSSIGMIPLASYADGDKTEVRVDQYSYASWQFKGPKDSYSQDKDGVIKVPTEGQQYSLGESTIRVIATVNGETSYDYGFYLDFSSVMGSENKVKVQSLGKVAIQKDVWSKLSEKTAAGGHADVPLIMTDNDNNDIRQVATLRFVNKLEEEKDPEVASAALKYKDAQDNEQNVSSDEDIFVCKGDSGSILVSGENAGTAKWTWTYGTNGIVSIDETGKLKAEKAGSTTVSMKQKGYDKELASFRIHVLDLSVSFDGASTGKVDIAKGYTLDIPSSESGTFSAKGAESLPDGYYLKWVTYAKKNKQIYIASETGKLSIYKAGSVDAWVEIDQRNTTYKSLPLNAFKINAADKAIDDVKVTVDGSEITSGSTVNVSGSEEKKLEVKVKYEGSDKYTEVNVNSYKLSSSDYDTAVFSDDKKRFRFEKPGQADITVTCGSRSVTFTAKSKFVPAAGITLKLPDTVEMDTLIYSMADGENYTGILGQDLADDYEIVPANASYKTVKWSNDNSKVAEYTSKFDNGFIGHSEGDTVITAELDQGSDGSKIT